MYNVFHHIFTGKPIFMGTIQPVFRKKDDVTTVSQILTLKEGIPEKQHKEIVNLFNSLELGKPHSIQGAAQRVNTFNEEMEKKHYKLLLMEDPLYL